MTLDYDIIRKILLGLEGICDGRMNFTIDHLHEQVFPDYPLDQLFYHLKYLANAEYIETSIPKEPFHSRVFQETSFSYATYIIDLTPKGHEFINNIRSLDIWDKTKNVMKPIGTVAIDVVSDIASSVIKKMLGSP